MTIDLISELRASAPPGTHVGDCMVRAADEIVRLRAALRQYGDRNRMAWAPSDLQATIDAAMSEPVTAADPRPSPEDHPLPPA